MKTAAAEYNAYVAELAVLAKRVDDQLRTQKIRNDSRFDVEIASTVISGTVLGLVGAANAGEVLRARFEAASEAIAESLPTAVGLSNDVTAPGRGASLLIGFAGSTVGQLLQLSAEQTAAILNAGNALLEYQKDKTFEQSSHFLELAEDAM